MDWLALAFRFSGIVPALALLIVLIAAGLRLSGFR